MLKQIELNEILNYTERGATLEQIAKHYGISLRTLARRLKNYKKEMNIARSRYKLIIRNMFES